LSKKKPNGRDNTTSAPDSTGGGPMDLGVLEKLVRLMRANDLSCVEVADGDRRILLKRGADAAIVQSAASTVAAAKPPPEAKPAPPSEEEGWTPIKSVMVGTFYAASSPDAPPFVQVGSAVEEDSDVCIIEAMKVFNTIKAECRGTIARILVTNGQPVEFGQPLFLVKP
jgi:acetyl-CoA carboxylase biotin carboxyl carrier protein